MLLNSIGPNTTLGTYGCPGYSCEYIKTQFPQAGNGIYWIQRPSSNAMPVYCEFIQNLKAPFLNGWSMIYKYSSLVGDNPYLLWKGQPLNAGNLSLLNNFWSPQHYVSSVVSSWPADLRGMRVHVYIGGALVQWIEFETNYTVYFNDSETWFDPSNVMGTSFDQTTFPKNPINDLAGQVFSIGYQNIERYGRYFYISWNQYNNRGFDATGFMMISTSSLVNALNIPAEIPYQVYAFPGGSSFGDLTFYPADVLAVFVRYDDRHLPPLSSFCKSINLLILTLFFR